MPITVKELIEKLKEFPDDYLVYSQGYLKGLSDIEYIAYDESLKRIYINISKPEINK